MSRVERVTGWRGNGRVPVSRPRIREAARQDAGRGKSDGSRIRRDTDWLSLDAWRIHADSRDSERNINRASFRSCALVLRQVPLSPSLLDLFRLLGLSPDPEKRKMQIIL